MEPHIVYNHSIECLRFALNTIGYDNCIKELNFIKHLQHSISSVKKEENIEVSTNVTESLPESLHIETESENKNIVIETPSKYSRTILPDSIRCTKLMDGGIRCSFKRANNTELCTRHSK
jgi:hypothetical protein